MKNKVYYSIVFSFIGALVLIWIMYFVFINTATMGVSASNLKEAYELANKSAYIITDSPLKPKHEGQSFKVSGRSSGMPYEVYNFTTRINDMYISASGGALRQEEIQWKKEGEYKGSKHYYSESVKKPNGQEDERRFKAVYGRIDGKEYRQTLVFMAGEISYYLCTDKFYLNSDKEIKEKLLINERELIRKMTEIMEKQQEKDGGAK